MKIKDKTEPKGSQRQEGTTRGSVANGNGGGTARAVPWRVAASIAVRRAGLCTAAHGTPRRHFPFGAMAQEGGRLGLGISQTWEESKTFVTPFPQHGKTANRLFLSLPELGKQTKFSFRLFPDLGNQQIFSFGPSPDLGRPKIICFGPFPNSESKKIICFGFSQTRETPKTLVSGFPKLGEDCETLVSHLAESREARFRIQGQQEAKPLKDTCNTKDVQQLIYSQLNSFQP